MRRQLKFTFQIGYPSLNASFEDAVIATASRLCGGCTVSHKVGAWCEDGASHADTFAATPEREHCFELELTCEEAKANRVYDVMRREISNAAVIYGIDANWVHVTETEMRGLHFSIDATLEANAKVPA